MGKSKLQRELPGKQRVDLIAALQARFERHTGRHQGVDWIEVQARLEARPDRLWSLGEMERTGGEPDVVGVAAGEFVFMDCSPESPAGRRSVCYDRAGLESRKEHRPQTTAMDLAAAMGITLLAEAEYLALQRLGEFDTKTSNWIATPAEFRAQGGALWEGRSYGRIFIGCNGAQSYYAGRGFRGSLRV